LFGIWATLYLIGCLPMAKLVNKVTINAEIKKLQKKLTFEYET